MDREGGNVERMRKCRERISLHLFILSPFPHSLSISSFSLHFLFISSFSHHFLILSPFPGSPDARMPQFVQPCIIDSDRTQLEDIRAQSIFKNLRFKVLLDGILYTYVIMIYINNGYYMQLK